MRALWLVIALAACGTHKVGECFDRADCGDRQICDVDSTCKTVECVESADCGPGAYCSESKCEPGCGTDDDCLAGEKCDEQHQCATYECRSTDLDCSLGEKCTGGACEPALGCNTCTTDADCGGGICTDWDPGPGTDKYCLVPCTEAGGVDQCGRGLQCRDLSGAGDLFCYADCPAYQRELKGR